MPSDQKAAILSRLKSRLAGRQLNETLSQEEAKDLLGNEEAERFFNQMRSDTRYAEITMELAPQE